MIFGLAPYIDRLTRSLVVSIEQHIAISNSVIFFSSNFGAILSFMTLAVSPKIFGFASIKQTSLIQTKFSTIKITFSATSVVISQNLPIWVVSPKNVMAFIKNEQTGSLKAPITMVEEIQKNLGCHDADLIFSQQFIPVFLVPQVIFAAVELCHIEIIHPTNLSGLLSNKTD